MRLERFSNEAELVVLAAKRRMRDTPDKGRQAPRPGGDLVQ